MPYIIAGGVMLLAALFTLTSAFITYKLIFARGKCVTDPYECFGDEASTNCIDDIHASVTRLLNTPFEAVNIISHDGLKLSARLYLVKEDAPFEIMMHGYRSLSTRDFSGGACDAMDRCHNILLVDQRAHGESEGKTISFGALEAEDCLGWIAFLNERFGNKTKIILLGISMGASTVLLASAKDLPENVKGVIADCPFSSAKAIIKKVGYSLHYPMKLLFPFVKLGARLFGRFSIEAAEPLAVIEYARVPILLIHGASDGFVPCEMSLMLKEKNPDISLHIFPGADHGASYCIDPERYKMITYDFLSSVLTEETAPEKNCKSE